MDMQKLGINKDDLLKKYTQNSPENKRSSGFTQLQNSLQSDKRLTKSDMLVYWAIKSHKYKGKEYCYPSLRTLSIESRCSKNTVIKSTKNLEDLGYIQVDRRRHKKEKSNCYYLLGNPP
jgi:hypothetical protein